MIGWPFDSRLNQPATADTRGDSLRHVWRENLRPMSSSISPLGTGPVCTNRGPRDPLIDPRGSGEERRLGVYPNCFLDPRGSGEERLGDNWLGTVRCEPSDGSPPLSVPIISPFGPGEERTGAIVCGIFSGKISALCPAVLAPWGPGRCVPTGGTPPPPDPLIDPARVGGGAAWDNWLGTGQM